jgi:hypothetical protein
MLKCRERVTLDEAHKVLLLALPQKAVRDAGAKLAKPQK